MTLFSRCATGEEVNPVFPVATLINHIAVSNFLFTLVLHLFILTGLQTACYLVNQVWPGTNADGYLAFMVFVAFAAILDATLTFLVFADSQANYAKLSSPEAFGQRFAGYLAAGGIALYLAHRCGSRLTRWLPGNATGQGSQTERGQGDCTKD